MSQNHVTGEHPVLGNPQAANPFTESGLFVSTADIWTPMKVAVDGGPGDGKTFAATEIARAIWAAEGKKGVVVLQDTERSAKAVIPYFHRAGLIENVNFFVSRSRSLLDYERILALCIDRRAILMIDSVTHIAEAFQEAFSKEKKRPISYPADALILKPEWKQRFSKPLVEAQCHILFTGRAAWEYRMEINEQTGKKEFNPTKLKMRGDPELLYEPDLVLFAEQTQEIDQHGDVQPHHWLTVLKDRTRLIQGKQFKFDPSEAWTPNKNPIWDAVKPVYEFYTTGAAAQKTPAETPMGPLFQIGNSEAFWERRRQVDVLLEEIEGVYAQWIPGSGGLEKQLRSMIFHLRFNTSSKSALAERTPAELKQGLDAIEYLSRYVAKNYDHLEKLYEKGEYETTHEFLSVESQRFDKGEIAPEPEDDDKIPDFALPAGKKPTPPANLQSALAASIEQAKQKKAVGTNGKKKSDLQIQV